MTRKPKPPMKRWCIRMTGSWRQYARKDGFLAAAAPSPDDSAVSGLEARRSFVLKYSRFVVM